MRASRALLLFVALVASTSAAAQTPIQYMYDDLGRLIAVVDPGGDTAVYEYDAVGNVLSIDRYDSADVSIISFSPAQGPVATTVTIHGTGFSGTPASNAVTFNGTAATVSSATTNKLVVTVPVGATTGPIAVTAPGGSDTSASAFTVGSTGAPTITTLTPETVVAGTTLTVEGTNFETTASHNNLRLNVSPVLVSSASTTELETTVPPSATTGYVSVTTPKGTAVSAGYLWVAPAPYAVADIASTGTLPIGSGTSVSVTTANKIALRAFEGSEGDRASIRITSGTANNYVYLYSPLGTVLNAAQSLPNGFLDTVTLRSTATYSIVFDPTTASSTSATLTIYDVPPDYASTMSAGTPVVATITTPGQNGLLTFSGTSGQRVSLVGASGTLLGQIAGCDVSVGLLNPDKGVLAAPSCMETGGFIEPATLAATGTFFVHVDPVHHATGNLSLTVHSVPADTTGTITAGGSSVGVTMTAPGQNGSLTFSGTSGDRISLQGTSGTIAGQIAGCDVNVSILKPDTTTLSAATCMETSGFIDVVTLPTTGTYTIVINPTTTATGSLTLTLHSVPADASGSITAGGSAVGVTITAPGQNGSLTFSGTSGDRISLQGTSGTIAGQIAGCDVNVSILKPDTTTLSAATCMETSGFIDVVTLPTTGTYTIVINPTTTAAGSLTLTLHSVPADVTTSLTVGGGSSTLTTTTPGQNGQATFAGTASQQNTVRLTSNSMGSTTVRLLKPDGSQLTSSTSSASSFNLATQTLPTTGTYTIVVDPGTTNVGSITVAVTNP